MVADLCPLNQTTDIHCALQKQHDSMLLKACTKLNPNAFGFFSIFSPKKS